MAYSAKGKCCFCKKEYTDYGNNAEPVMDARCCNDCNEGVVIPIRLVRHFKENHAK